MNLHMPFTSSHFGLINTVNALILKIIDLQVLHVCLTWTATVAFNYVLLILYMYALHTSHFHDHHYSPVEHREDRCNQNSSLPLAAPDSNNRLGIYQDILIVTIHMTIHHKKIKQKGYDYIARACNDVTFTVETPSCILTIQSMHIGFLFGQLLSMFCTDCTNKLDACPFYTTS